MSQFSDLYFEKQLPFQKDSFMVKKISERYNYLKEKIKENEAKMSLNVLENYSFILQNEIRLLIGGITKYKTFTSQFITKIFRILTIKVLFPHFSA